MPVILLTTKANKIPGEPLLLAYCRLHFLPCPPTAVRAPRSQLSGILSKTATGKENGIILLGKLTKWPSGRRKIPEKSHSAARESYKEQTVNRHLAASALSHS